MSPFISLTGIRPPEVDGEPAVKFRINVRRAAIIAYGDLGYEYAAMMLSYPEARSFVQTTGGDLPYIVAESLSQIADLLAEEAALKEVTP